MKALRNLAYCSFFAVALINNVTATPLQNGGSVDGFLATGTTVNYTFPANAGDRVSIQAVDTGTASQNISPHLHLYRPDGTLVGSDSAGTVASLINRDLNQSGEYSVQLLHRSVHGGTGDGPFSIHLSRVPGADENGELPNGGSKNGTLTLGDIDTYTFQGDAGDRFSIQIGDTGNGQSANISPYLFVFNPDGSFLRSESDGSVAGEINVSLPQTGSYAVQVLHRSVHGGSGTGPYTVHFAKAPGANEGGLLANGSVTSGNLTIGDIDTYTFVSNEGDTVSVQVSDTGDGQGANISPNLHIFNPDGSLLRSDSDGAVASESNVRLSQSGVHTVQITHRTVHGGTGVGPYSVSFNCVGVCANTAPSAPISISPDATTDDATPEYQWYAVSNASWYYLSVTNTQGIVHEGWYTASDAGCGNGSGVCGVTPTTSISGNANWRVYGWNTTGSGPWSSTLSFNVQSTVPGPTTLISPAVTSSDQPTFTWDRVTNSTWYYLWINHNGTSFRKWYTESDANCNATTCSVTPALSLSGAVTWWVRTWNTAGNGDWSTSLSFSVSSDTPPGQATLITPSGSNSGLQPTFRWNAVAGATWYQLWVNDSTGTPINKWYTREQASCASGTGTCQLTPSQNVSGSATWWIRTWNSKGNGPWSNGLSFTP